MQLDDRPVERHERVVDRPGVVAERAGVDDDRRGAAPRAVDAVDQLTLVVRLEVLEGEPVPLGLGATRGDVIVERLGTVDVRLPLAEQVQVRARQQQDDGRRHVMASVM